MGGPQGQASRGGRWGVALMGVWRQFQPAGGAPADEATISADAAGDSALSSSCDRPVSTTPMSRSSDSCSRAPSTFSEPSLTAAQTAASRATGLRLDWGVG